MAIERQHDDTHSFTIDHVAEHSPPPKGRMRREPLRARPAAGNTVAADLPQAMGIPPIGTLVAAQRDQMTALSAAGITLMDGLSEIQIEMIDFGQRRTNAVLEQSQKLPQPAGWSDLLTCQFGYTGAAARDYIDEAVKLFDLGRRISEESWKPLRQSMAAGLTATARHDA